MLSDFKIKNAKPAEKDYLMNDGFGLNLLVTKKGGKYWRMRYWVDGKERRMSLGTYPAVSLKEAREKARDIARIRDAGADPRLVLKRRKLNTEDTFEAIAREWIDKQINGVRTDKYTRAVIHRMEQHVFPYLGRYAIRELEAPEILAVLREIEDAGKIYSAHQVSTYCARVFRYAIATGRAERNPVSDLQGALKPRQRIRHRAAITEVGKIKQLLRTMQVFDASPVVYNALWFSAYTFCRPGEIRRAEWREIDSEAKEWRIPADKMKMRRAHIVPLSDQAMRILEALRPITGRGQYIFPSARSPKGTEPMSENAVLYALRRMGFSADEMTAHGFRGMASTRLNEMGWRADVIERQLAHIDGNSVRSAYNHAEYLDERRRMMQEWADWLDGLLNA